MRIKISELAAQEVPEILEFWGRTRARVPPSRRSLLRFLEGGFGKVMRFDGEIVAATLFSICGPGEAYFEGFAVSERHRRKGFGQMLYEACIFDLRARGISRAICVVNNENEVARLFWNQMGVRPIKSAKVYFGRIPRPKSAERI